MLRRLVPFLLALAVVAAPVGSIAFLASVPDECIRFAIIGDYGDAGQAEADVAALIANWNPDFIITTGDNNYPDGRAETIDENIGQYFHAFIHPYTGSYGAGAESNRFFPTLGNHDWRAPGAQPYLDYFDLPNNERYYDFTWGPVHFFAIDADTHEPDGREWDSIQGQWFEERMNGSTLPWQVAYMHNPPYSSGGTHGSAVPMRWPYQEWGVDVVVAGHDHIYERLAVDGLPYFVNGLGGKSLYELKEPIEGSQFQYNGDFGAQRVDACDEGMTLAFISRAGVLVDSLTLGEKPGPTPTATPVPVEGNAVYLPLVE